MPPRPIPPELGKLTALVKLDLGDNQLSGPIPPELGKLTALVKLQEALCSISVDLWTRTLLVGRDKIHGDQLSRK
ncbi:unnamed protein product [Ectocarpus sp. CCAP 1310/34]|nr:unnamed protein product [Ectocarpus sp. CCAP 1310/34]